MIPCSINTCHNLEWKKQLAQAVTSPAELLSILNLKSDELGLGKATELFGMKVPHAFIARMEKNNPKDPLFLQVWPEDKEFELADGFSKDPLQEQSANPIPGLLHKYGSRVLTISAASCAVNCRYCFRRHFPYDEQKYGDSNWQDWLDYVTKHPEINEIILSGGDPLLLSDEKLSRLFNRISSLPQIKRVRIHSRLPLVIPNRITQDFLELCTSVGFRVILVWHINHANEIDQHVKEAAEKCHAANIMQLNQSVLLKGVNDTCQQLQSLSEKLFDCMIQPYYLHTLDPVQGAAHFELPESVIRDIYSELLASLPGFLVPKLVKEEANRRSKTPLLLS
ncbi:MAG: EF-P beta-lysylation protein EpmB [Gammaproteobacteria bacterium]|nr:EF-P beta-lysylation protein EpmB [Gammaproteobacteria bacterium]